MKFVPELPKALALAALAVLAVPAHLPAEARPIDTGRSTVTIYAYKSGLFSLFADDHIIRAQLAGGSISEQPPLSVEVAIHAAALTVLDPDLAADRRAEVQTRMLGPEVLDVAKFPDITFASTTVEPTRENQWKVTGRLTIRGRTQVVTFTAVKQNGVYRGDVTIGQRDFGIQPISIVGGTVRVKNELKIRFEILPADAGAQAQ